VWSSAPKTLLALRFDEAQPASATPSPRSLGLPWTVTPWPMCCFKASRTRPRPFARLALGICFPFRESYESGTRQGDSRLASGQRSRRHRTPALARGCRWRPDEIAWRTRGRECSSSESVRAGRDALLIRKRWRGSGLARQSSIGCIFSPGTTIPSRRARSWSHGEPASFGAGARNHSAAHRSGAALRQERRMLEERRVLPLVLLPEYVGIAALCATGCPRAGANGALPMSGSKKARALRPRRMRCIAR